MQKPEAILFDWDATLAETYALMEAAHNHTLKHFGQPERAPGWLRPIFGQAKEESYIKIYGPDFADQFDDIDRVFVAYVQEHHLDLVTPIAGAKKALDFIQSAGIPMAIVTNKRQFLFEPELKKFGWEAYFDTFVTSGMTPHNKPHRAPVDLALKKLALTDPQKIWLVGDSSSDQGAAKHAGCGFIHFHDGSMPDLDYNSYAPIISCASYSEFTEKISNIL